MTELSTSAREAECTCENPTMTPVGRCHNCYLPIAGYQARDSEGKGEAGKWQVTQETSDGYHSFRELYEHRNLLFINLCRQNCGKSYWKYDPETPGWVILYLELSNGQISYHVSDSMLHLFDNLEHRPNAKWDGHNSRDVVDRLSTFAGMSAPPAPKDERAEKLIAAVKKYLNQAPVDGWHFTDCDSADDNYDEGLPCSCGVGVSEAELREALRAFKGGENG